MLIVPRDTRDPEQAHAGVAHPVERHLAKVEVASSSLVTRSIKETLLSVSFLFICPPRRLCAGAFFHGSIRESSVC